MELTTKQTDMVAHHLYVAESVVAEFSRRFNKHPEKGRRGHDDMQSEAYVSLCEAATSYDPEHKRGASFHTYARYRIRGRLLNILLRSSGVRKHDPLELLYTKGIRYDDGNDDCGGRDPTYFQTVEIKKLTQAARVDADLMVDSLLNLCTEIERMTVELTCIQGMSESEAGVVLGVHRTAVNKAKKRAFRRMKTGRKFNSERGGRKHKNSDISLGDIPPTTDTSGEAAGSPVPDLPGSS